MSEAAGTILEAEVIYGALRREKFWQIGFAGMALVAMVSVGSAAGILYAMRPPAPVVVPFDPATGLAVPNASVEAISLDERTAVVQSLVWQYVTDRETYNQIDNDVRINRALARTDGTARRAFLALWDSGSDQFLPDRYGDRAQVEVVITSITPLPNDRVQVRMRKRLTNPDGATVGNFTAVIGYKFAPGEERTLEAVWANPLGFTVSEYSITQDRRE
ncbi:virB8 family protein [Jannaschia aquimarina]|uniref:VirB8 protein n=1 Tax=Jannaschia aquimarina TaxID=935700 RepID=A0A0D1EI45_9RHOB|nr:type IV secretion system protein [Jannaschia aquimarina]KIT16571.1 VirB8 protein [Jannaschia aquimarina]SNT41687.1 type IV secretion system protein VirB8 [Jannaschia aquimarina]